ncbi:MAG: 50S ribosomal protein L5 [Acidimicrobiaceae bacterium]|nr:50S ribosomal protein L5 [Acidimicrobiaceae bacterium]
MADGRVSSSKSSTTTATASTSNGLPSQSYKPRLKAMFDSEICSDLQKQLGLPNIMMVPKLHKIVLNMGVGGTKNQARLLEGAMVDMAVISGQKPAVTRARYSLASFKLRAGMAIGCKATIRGNRMYEFFDRLVNLAIPRIRDFRGLSRKSFDGSGNYTFGITEQLIFPEINYDSIDTVRGMDVTIVTTAKSDEEARTLLEALGFPLRSEG